MNLPLRTTPHPKGPAVSQPCPVCDKRWTPWAGSVLPCHARCLFTPKERLALVDDPRTEKDLALHHGVSTHVIRSAKAHAVKKERKRAATAPPPARTCTGVPAWVSEADLIDMRMRNANR